jgi:flagellar protein FliO/FliZ
MSLAGITRSSAAPIFYQSLRGEESNRIGATDAKCARATGFFGSLRMTILGLGFFAAAAAFAADDNQIIFPGSTRAESPAKSAGATLNSLSLIVGVALAGVGGWLLWRNRRGTPAGRDVRSLAIDETRSLGNRQYLVVASYEGKKFLIGVCPGRIDMLSPLESAVPAAFKVRE